MSVADRWHKSRPGKGGEPCREHRLPPACGHGDGDRWQARWRDDTGQQRKRNFGRKADADSFDARMKADRDSGTALDMAAGKAQVRDYAKAWRADLLHRDSTAERMDRVFRLHVDPVIGHLRMGQVRPAHMRGWVKNRAAVLAPSTLAVAWSDVAAMFGAAVADKVIGSSPCAGVRLPDAGRHANYVPSPAQVHALAGALAARYAAIAYVAAGCGMRGGEITGLEADAVDFLRREIDVSQQLVCVSGQRPFLGPVKTATSARTAELPAVTGAAVARHMELYPPVTVVIEDRTDPDPRRHRQREARLLFTTVAERPLHRATWAHIWGPAARAAGIPHGTGLHCLRHYFATLLIHHGASVKTVQLALGHSTPMVTLNTYVGEWPEALERTRSIVDAALGSVPGLCPGEALR